METKSIFNRVFSFVAELFSTFGSAIDWIIKRFFALIGMLTLTTIIVLLFALMIKSATASGEIDYCRCVDITMHAQTAPVGNVTSLEGVREWRFNETLARYPSYDECAQNAAKINCELK